MQSKRSYCLDSIQAQVAYTLPSSNTSSYSSTSSSKCSRSLLAWWHGCTACKHTHTLAPTSNRLSRARVEVFTLASTCVVLSLLLCCCCCCRSIFLCILLSTWKLLEAIKCRLIKPQSRCESIYRGRNETIWEWRWGEMRWEVDSACKRARERESEQASKQELASETEPERENERGQLLQMHIMWCMCMSEWVSVCVCKEKKQYRNWEDKRCSSNNNNNNKT